MSDVATLEIVAPLAELQFLDTRLAVDALVPMADLSLVAAELVVDATIPIADLQLIRPESKVQGPFFLTVGHGFRVTVTYASPFVRGQVVYLDFGVGRPVTNATPFSVLNILAMVETAGGAGESHTVLLNGVIKDPAFVLAAGPVFLGDDGFPVSADDEDANYVPLGYSQGGDEFFFSPRERFFR